MKAIQIGDLNEKRIIDQKVKDIMTYLIVYKQKKKNDYYT